MNITAQDFARRLVTLITTRCLLGIVFLTIVFISSIRNKHDLLSPFLFPLYAYALLLLFFTVAGGLLFSYSRKQLEITKKLTFYGNIQLLFDIFSVSLFVYFSGGVISPFSVFYIPVIIIGAYLFGIRGAILTGAMCFIAYGLILVSQFYGLFLTYTFATTHELKNVSFLPGLLTNMVSFAITALLSGFLVDKWHIAEEHFKDTISQLKFLRSLHENILENIPSGVIVINHDKTILYANKMAGHILGTSLEEMLKKSTNEVLNFNFEIEEVTYITRKEMEYRNNSTGETITLGYTIHSIFLSPKKRVWIFLFQDLTNIKRLQREIEEAERMSFIGRIAASIAHNIKNPLGAIYGSAQLIDREPSCNTVTRKAASIIMREVKRIDNIVRDFVKLSLSGISEKLQEKIDPLFEIQKICQRFHTENEIESGYHIDIKNKVSDPLIISINSSDFELVIWNILLNAAEAMPQGGNIEITLDIKTDKPDGSDSHDSRYVCISIRDHGDGIEPEIMEKIFQPFFTTKPRGTGLGLNIVNHVVRKYSGFVRLKSSRGEGTEFSVYFPISDVGSSNQGILN